MATLPNPDRDKEYMYKMWGTNKLITDYTVSEEKQTLQEIMHDDIGKRHNLAEQSKKHQKIRNDIDYDDWEYGTEPIYGLPN